MPPDTSPAPAPAAMPANVIEQFKAAINAGDVTRASELLRLHPLLRSSLNEPWFSFDAPALVHAASRQDRAMVDLLLDAGADVNARTTWWAGSFAAVHLAYPALAEHLIGRGAAVDVHAAAHVGMLDRLRELIDADPKLVHARGGDGQTPLHFAANRDVAAFLIERGAEIDARDVDHGSTPAQWAVPERPEVARFLVERGAEPDLFMAAILGDVAIAERCLKADPRCLGIRIGQGKFTAGHDKAGHIYLYRLGYTARPLHVAARRGHKDLVEFLLDRSTLTERLLLACDMADPAEVEAILAQSPDIARTLGPADMRLISDAAWDGRAEAVRVMLEAGFDVNARGGDNGTPLDRAAVHGNLALVELLLEYEAKLDVTNDYGGTPLGACIWGSANFCDPKGDYPACAERLLAAGAKPPANGCGSAAVAEVLRRHGAK